MLVSVVTTCYGKYGGQDFILDFQWTEDIMGMSFFSIPDTSKIKKAIWEATGRQQEVADHGSPEEYELGQMTTRFNIHLNNTTIFFPKTWLRGLVGLDRDFATILESCWTTQVVIERVFGPRNIDQNPFAIHRMETTVHYEIPAISSGTFIHIASGQYLAILNQAINSKRDDIERFQKVFVPQLWGSVHSAGRADFPFEI